MSFFNNDASKQLKMHSAAALEVAIWAPPPHLHVISA